MIDQSTFQLREQAATDAAVAPSRRDGKTQDPGALAGNRGEDGAHQFMADLCYERGLAAPHGGEHLGHRNHRPRVGFARLLLDQQPDRAVEVVVVEIAYSPYRDDANLGL